MTESELEEAAVELESIAAFHAYRKEESQGRDKAIATQIKGVLKETKVRPPIVFEP